MQERRSKIIHQAGRGNAEPLLEIFRGTGLTGEVVDFITDMPAAFARADLVVCRSGASTVSELAAAGRPSIWSRFRSLPIIISSTMRRQ